MAFSLLLRSWCSLLLLLCVVASFCHSYDGQETQDPVGIVGRALQCFNDHYVYSSCEESYRLSAQGNIDVPREATDVYCEGPCLVETKLVLSCINEILFNFRFYNGASIRDVRYTLDSGCGHTDRRGDFDVLEHLGDDYEGYGSANMRMIPVYLLLIISACCLLLWAY